MDFPYAKSADERKFRDDHFNNKLRLALQKIIKGWGGNVTSGKDADNLFNAANINTYNRRHHGYNTGQDAAVNESVSKSKKHISEGKMKEIAIELEDTPPAEFKKKYGMTKNEMQRKLGKPSAMKESKEFDDKVTSKATLNVNGKKLEVHHHISGEAHVYHKGNLIGKTHVFLKGKPGGPNSIENAYKHNEGSTSVKGKKYPGFKDDIHSMIENIKEERSLSEILHLNEELTSLDQANYRHEAAMTHLRNIEKGLKEHNKLMQKTSDFGPENYYNRNWHHELERISNLIHDDIARHKNSLKARDNG